MTPTEISSIDTYNPHKKPKSNGLNKTPKREGIISAMFSELLRPKTEPAPTNLTSEPSVMRLETKLTPESPRQPVSEHHRRVISAYQKPQLDEYKPQQVVIA